jgi:hypothetical protein
MEMYRENLELEEPKTHGESKEVVDVTIFGPWPVHFGHGQCISGMASAFGHGHCSQSCFTLSE